MIVQIYTMQYNESLMKTSDTYPKLSKGNPGERRIVFFLEDGTFLGYSPSPYSGNCPYQGGAHDKTGEYRCSTRG